MAAESTRCCSSKVVWGGSLVPSGLLQGNSQSPCLGGEPAGDRALHCVGCPVPQLPREVSPKEPGQAERG